MPTISLFSVRNATSTACRAGAAPQLMKTFSIFAFTPKRSERFFATASRSGSPPTPLV